jgi:hypothetical protein
MYVITDYCNNTSLTTTIAELDVFMNSLKEDSINRAIACFRDAIATREILPSDFDPAQAQKACNRILHLTGNASTLMDDIRKVPRFWVNLQGLANNSNLNALEACITRVFCMRGALILHHWLLNVVPAAVKRSSRSMWIDKLVWDVRMAMDMKKLKDFDSDQYLPNLKHPRTFAFVPPKQFRFDQTELVTSTVSSILRVWLQFPTDELSLVQLSIIEIVLSKSPPSVMFLDKVWETYKTPFTTVFKKWNTRKSKAKIETALEDFRKQYASHAFATAGSIEYQKLQYLDQMIHEWMDKNNLDVDERGAVRQIADTFREPS